MNHVAGEEQRSSGSQLYRNAGVDTTKADRLVDWLSLSSNGQESNIGDFSACYTPDFSGMEEPVLVSSTDGIGTKLLLAIDRDSYAGLGYDLVGMCVNDLYTLGAKPLFFLDYFACGALDSAVFKQILGSIKAALASCNTALVGGETAELPGIYKPEHFDLAGFVVGVLDRQHKLGAQRVRSGSHLMAFPSSGFHSNGFSLLRQWIDQGQIPNESLEYLLTPTRIYSSIPKIYQEMGHSGLQAIAHITGGGLQQNLSRVIPDHLLASIDFERIKIPAQMAITIKAAGHEPRALLDVFNLGVGMVCVVSEDQRAKFEDLCKKFDQPSYKIGRIKQRQDHPTNVVVN